MPNQQITHQRLVEVLHYDPETGAVSWRDQTRGRRAVVGCKRPDGRSRVVIDGVRYVVSRLCWFYAHGAWPAGQVDHINGDPTDDRLVNLRDVPAALNNQNRRRAHRKSKTRRIGVIRARTGTCSVAMSYRGRPLTVSGFPSENEASAAYVDLKRRLHDGFVEVQP